MPTGVQRWRFVDPYTGENWTFPHNPSAMSSPFPTRNITTKVTTAVDGQALMFEGNTSPTEWTFQGVTLDPAHYESLRAWVYDNKRRRIHVFDHFGRQITCVLQSVSFTPKRAVNRYWKHDYEVKAIVISVGAPSVGL